MDINEALNEIIFKYHLDRYYPHYRKMYEAEKILKNVIENIVQNNAKAIFVGDDEKEISFVRNLTKVYNDIHFYLYNRRDLGLSRLKEIDWKKYNKVYLISFYGAEHVERWFRQHNVRYEWIYDVFEKGGVFCESEFFAFGKKHLLSLFDPKNRYRTSSPYTASAQSELYCQRNKYNYAEDCKTKRIALERCLFLTIYMRNFIAAKEYAELLMNSDEQYKYMWEEIESLLNRIKQILNNRKQEDIILYWLDCISYGGECDMPYLQSVMEKSVVFENAFTYIGFTNPTMRAMFLGKKDIDDRGYGVTSITKENSPVVRILEEQGYDIRIISDEFSASFQPQYQEKKITLDWMVPASMKYWDMISGMLMQERKTLWLAHTLAAHPPYLSRGMNDSNYLDGKIKYRLAKREVDEQLSFYDTLINKDAVRIYMSDHGNDAIYKYHVLFNVHHRSIKPRKIEGLFSILDFGTVLKQLILDGDIKEKEFVREYVEIGNLDWYNYEEIGKIFRNKEGLNLRFFGHKGIIDKEYVYIHYTSGKEFLQKRNDTLLCEPLLFYDCENDVCNPELLSKYRKLAGEYPKSIMSDEKFKYSRYIHILYHNIMQHNDIEKRIDIINRMIRKYPDGSVGIRMGGVASAMLYQVLSKENRKKIWGFIDNSEQCLCSKLHLPVLLSDQTEKLEALGVKAVLLPSYSYLKMLREESKTWSAAIDVLDIYDCLEKNGIECRDEFYTISGTDRDYEVGFPFND